MRMGIGVMATVAAGVLAAAPVRADVIEIGGDGSTHLRSGAGTVVWTGGDAGQAEDAPAVPAEAVTPLVDVAAPDAYRATLAAAAQRYSVSPQLLAALVARESGWRASAVSVKGATGLAQLMPGTARMLAVDARDPAANLAGGAAYLRRMLDLFDGDVERALAAYNAGPGRVIRARGVPAITETRAYVSTIIDRLALAPAGSAVRELTR